MSTDLDDFIQALSLARQKETHELIRLYERATGESPVLSHPGIVAFGHYEYQYASGRSGGAAAAGFAPRYREISVYLSDGVQAHADLLAELGPHRAGVGCLYLKLLADADLAVLEQIVHRSYARLTSGTYGLRARQGGSVRG